MKARTLRLAGLTAIIFAGWAASAYGETRAMSSRAMEALSANAADAKAKQDLLSILQPASKYRQGMFVAVRGVEMRTIPHGVGVKGFCAMDELSLSYAPTAARAEAMEEPRRPIGISVKHFYRADRAADYLDDRGSIDEKVRVANIWSQQCERLRSDKKATWFEAETVTEAMDAVNALHAATDALRAGKLQASRCDYPTDQGETCSQAILKAAYVDKISTVGHNCQAGAGQSCFDLYLSGDEHMAVTVVFSLKNNSPTPEDVVSVSAGGYVTVT